MGADDLGDRLDVVDDAGRGLAQRREDDLDARVGGEQAVDLGRVEAAAPAGLVARGVGLVGVGELDPALAELARRAREHAVAGPDEVRDGGLHGARAARREQEHVVARAEDRGQALEDARVELTPAGSRWYRIGSAIAVLTLGGSGVGPAVMRYCLMNGLGVMSLSSLAAGGRRSEAEVDAQACGGVWPSLPGGRFHLETPVATAFGLYRTIFRDLWPAVRRRTGVGETIAAMTRGRFREAGVAEAREAALPAASAAPSPRRAAAARGVASSTERALVRAAQGGSAEAMEELFRRHWPRAHRAAWLVVHDAAAAEDVAQEAFLAAVRALDRFDRRRPFGPWLHRIVVNRAIDYARARGAAPRGAGATRWRRHGPSSSRVTRPRARSWRRSRGLAPEHRAVIVLRHLLEFTPGEIAQVLGLPRGTVNSRLRRGLDALAEPLRPDPPAVGPGPSEAS